MSKEFTLLPSSFRDPAAVIYNLNGEIYRQINPSGLGAYQQLMSSGLYKRLESLGYLIPHIEVSPALALEPEASCVLKPEQILFISYPYEWCFSQLKDAALLTLDIAKIAIKRCKRL